MPVADEVVDDDLGPLGRDFVGDFLCGDPRFGGRHLLFELGMGQDEESLGLGRIARLERAADLTPAHLAPQMRRQFLVEIVDAGLGMFPGCDHLHHALLYPFAIPADGEAGVNPGFPRLDAMMVTPTGGMSHSQKARIFEPFVSCDQPRCTCLLYQRG